MDKEAREEFCDIVHDILNPYVSNFLPKQLAVLQSRLAGILFPRAEFCDMPKLTKPLYQRLTN